MASRTCQLAVVRFAGKTAERALITDMHSISCFLKPPSSFGMRSAGSCGRMVGNPYLGIILGLPPGG